MKQDYPQTLPPAGARPWTSISFRTRPNEYLKAVLDYALEGNKEVDFVVQNNTTRGWYHAPWMHTGPAGREFIRGLTRERSSRPGELHPNQTGTFENWAVSVYNPRGGYTIGRVWKDPDAPNPSVAKFPVGTVSVKLIFTEAPVSQVPYLTGSVEWQADINRANNAGPRPTLRLLQVDVAVRDSRATPTTGWVFGTFVYDGNASGATPWDRLVPVGLMWGNDPTRVGTTQPLRESKVNPDLQIPQHLGFEKRVNGPVDNPRSSCLSCHSTAQINPDLSRASRSAIPPANASLSTLRLYFRNIKAGEPFDAGARSLDYSLQLQNGIANWAQANPDAPPAATSPSRPAAASARRLDRSRGVNVTPVGRDGYPMSGFNAVTGITGSATRRASKSWSGKRRLGARGLAVRAEQRTGNGKFDPSGLNVFSGLALEATACVNAVGARICPARLIHYAAACACPSNWRQIVSKYSLNALERLSAPGSVVSPRSMSWIALTVPGR